MRKLALILMIAVPMLVIGGGAIEASAQVVLGLGGGTLQGTYSCKGQGHGANDAPTGLFLAFTANGTGGIVAGGELGTHVNSAFCFFTVTGGTVVTDEANVGRLTLNLQPEGQPAQTGPLPLVLFGPACKPMTETYAFTGVNQGLREIDITETDNIVEAGGRCILVPTPLSK
jgi:hypothetical protein